MRIILYKAYSPDWEYIRKLRNQNSQGFISQKYITKEEHFVFMSDNSDDYYIVTYNGKDIGFCGVVNNDVRFCVDEKWHGAGLGTEILIFLREQYPQAIGKVKLTNYASHKAFEKAGYQMIYKDLEFYYFVTDKKYFNASQY